MSIPFDVRRQYFVPQHGLSRFAGFLANATHPKLKNFLIQYFLKRYSVNLSEAEIEDPFAYTSFNDFFTRKLKKGARPMSDDPNDLISPADSALYQCGNIKSDTLLHAKNHDYTLSALLGNKDKFSDAFIDGSYACFYLAPHDYHRVHMPASGRLLKMRYVPGRLFSVNQSTAKHVENIFARNERVVCFFENAHGKFVVILVGAMIVGGIHTSWAGKIAPNKQGMRETDYTENPIRFRKGDEMGHFCLGSTAIVLFDKQATLSNTLKSEQKMRVGQTIGAWTTT